MAGSNAPRDRGAAAGAPAVEVWWLRPGGDGRHEARALLRRAAAAALGVDVTEIGLGRSAAGRPLLTGAGARLHASISHTRGLVVVAVTPVAPVGVDVEAVRDLPAAGLARRWLRPEEAAWVTRVAPERQSERLLVLWTRKEAAGKARGTGLAGGGLRAPVGHDRPLPADRLAPLPGVHDLVLAAPAVGEGFVAALACGRQAAGAPLTIRDATPGAASAGVHDADP